MGRSRTRAAKPPKHRSTPPPLSEITSEKTEAGTPDRAYYRTVWGFDPVADARDLADGWRRLEAVFPLDLDPPLKAAGVTICARVDWRGDEVRNRIVFRRETSEATVDCLHMVVLEGPAGEILARDREEIWDYVREGRGRGSPIQLPAAEHFAALRSFVAGIAELGVLRLATTQGINDALLRQIRRGVKKIAPHVWDAKFFDRVAAIATERGHKRLVHLFRAHTTLDGVQNRLFKNPELLTRVQEFLPDIPWNPLQLEWQARRAIRHNIKITERQEWEDDDLWEVPHVEVFPRGSLCMIDFPAFLFPHDPDFNSPGVARARLDQFFRRHTVEGKILRLEDKHMLQKMEDTAQHYPSPSYREELEDRKHGILGSFGKMVAAHPLAPPDVVAFLARSPCDNVRAEVAKRPDLPPEIQAQLAGDASQKVKWALTEVGQPETITRRPNNNKDVSLASNPATPHDVLTSLAQDKKVEIRKSVAENPAAPAVLLEALARDLDPNVKEGIFRNPALPAAILVQMARDPDSWVRGRVARHRATPVEILELLARDPDVHVRAELAGNPNIGHALMNRLAKETDIEVLKALARNPSCAPKVLSRVSREDNWEISRALVSHPASPPAVLRDVTTHWDFRLRLELAVREDVGADLLEVLARDKQPSVRVIAQARLDQGGRAHPPAPGQILSPGEILWLLVSHPNKWYSFVSLGEDDVSPEHARWLRDLLEKWPQIKTDVGKICLGNYNCVDQVWGHGWDGCLNEYDGEPHWTTYHLALDGLRQIVCGKLPCILWECDVKLY